MKRDTLVQLTVKELRVLATQKGISNVSHLLKSELINALATSNKSSPAPSKSSSASKAHTVNHHSAAAPTKTKARIKSKKNSPVRKSTRTRKRISSTAPKRKLTALPAIAPTPVSASSLRIGAPATPHQPPAIGTNPGLPIPEHYGRDRLILMVQDPLHIFAYWELQGETVARAINETHGGDPVLIIYNNSKNETRHVDLRGGNYYLSVHADQEYEAELALRHANGNTHVLVRSNKVRTPAPSISQRIDEQWMGVDEVDGTFHELLELAGLPGQVAGANSVTRLRDKHLAEWNWQHSGMTAISSSVLSSDNRSSSARLAP
jgi:hypothetical protein